MGLWEEVMEFWEKGTACFSKPMEMLGQVTGVTFTFNEDEELKTIKEKLEEENKLLRAKTKAYDTNEEIKALYEDALKAMRNYAGQGDPDEY